MKADNSVDPSDLKVNLLTQEIKFAKMLAGNEFNGAIKEKHIKKLAIWLKNRSACSHVFTDKDCLRIWKGLFYSMWMSDKPLPQESLATKIASLLHSFDQIESCVQFFAMFLKTMALEWNGIDQWRIDKFMMLVRKVTREMLRILQSKEWDADVIDQLSTRLDETVLNGSTPRGLFMHFIELFFEEVGKVSNGEIEAVAVTHLLKPFMHYVASQRDYKLIHCVTKHVFNYLLFQSEAGREYQEKYDAWKSMGFPGNSLDDLVLETPEEDIEDADSEAEDSEEGEDEVNVKEDGEDEVPEKQQALDPRAGRVDVVMPEIKFNPTEIAEGLEELKYKKFTNVRNRKCIDRIVSSYKKFATGEFPLGIQRLKIDRENLHLPDTEDKAIEIMAFEDKLLENTRALKKVNKRKRKKILASSPLQSKCNKVAKTKHSTNTWIEEDMTADDLDGSTSDEPRPIKKAKKLKVVEQKTLNGFVNSNEDKLKKSPAKKHKQCNGLAELAAEEVSATSPAKKQKHSKQLNGIADIDDAPFELPAKSPVKKHKQPKEFARDSPSVETEITPKLSTKKHRMSNDFNDTSNLETSVKSSSGTPHKSKPKLSTPQQPNADANTSQSKLNGTPKTKKKSTDWDTPLEDGETEYFIPSKKAKAYGVQSTHVTKETPSPKVAKIKSPKSAQCTPQMDRLVALKNSTPKSSLLSAEKKVKIVLQMNKSQEATEYIRQLKQSPNLPFDSNKKPLKGVLKPNLLPSPINPFYKKMIGLK